MSTSSRLLLAGALFCAAIALLPPVPASAAGCPAPGSSGPISTCSVVSSQNLHPGVTVYHLRASVSGAARRQDLYQVVWRIGDAHVRLHSGILGGYDGGSIALGPISSWAGWG